MRAPWTALAGLALCCCAAASPLAPRRLAAQHPALALRGGAAGDNLQRTKDDYRDSARNTARDVTNEAKERADHVKAEQVVPLAVGLVAIAQGLEMLLNPQRTSRFFDGNYVATDADKTSAAMLGARELIKGAGLAVLAGRNDERSLRLANGLTLASVLVEEGVDQLTAHGEGFRTVAGTNRRVSGIFRLVVSALTVTALYSMRDSGTTSIRDI
jgi:hypothetical protein